MGKFTPVCPPRIAQSGPGSPNQGPARPIRARLAQSGPGSPNQGPAQRPMRGRLEEHLDHLNIREKAGGFVWVIPWSKCASCHSNETDQRNIHTHVNVSSKAYVYDETIYNSCARARFAGCTYLRNIILALNTVYTGIKKLYRPLCNHGNRKQQYYGTVMVLILFKTNGRYQKL
jgi:hypothetical protein